MAVIENFDAISVQEQMKFAEALLNTINSERIFTDEVDYKVASIEADEMTGGLIIQVDSDGPMAVAVEAAWVCDDEDDAYHVPSLDRILEEASIYEAAKKSFKTLSTVIEGYQVSLEIDDVNEGSIEEVEVDDVSQEDDGIGSYEAAGYRGYQSIPYLQAEGALIKECEVYVTFYVEPVDAFEDTEVPAEEPTPEIE